MTIEKQKLLTNPSRTFGELQAALSIDQSFDRRVLQEISRWHPNPTEAGVLKFTRFFQFD
jgi:hypothetical protein